GRPGGRPSGAAVAPRSGQTLVEAGAAQRVGERGVGDPAVTAAAVTPAAVTAAAATARAASLAAPLLRRTPLFGGPLGVVQPQAQRDALARDVHVEHLHPYDVARLDDLARVLDEVLRHR